MTRQNWATVGAVILLLFVLAWGQRSGIPAKQRENAEQTVEVCRAVNEVTVTLRTYILQQIKRSERTLPTLEYYKNRPVELGRALANITRQK